MIKLNNLNKYFFKGKNNEIHVIDNTTLELPDSGLVSFLGHSGSGKTSSVRNLLKKNHYVFIRTHCESSTTFEQLILNAFDALNVFVISGKSRKHTSTLKEN